VGRFNWEKGYAGRLPKRAVEDQKREEDHHDRESEIDNPARELDPFSDQVCAVAQQRD